MNKAVTILLRFLVISSISSVVLLIIQRSPRSYGRLNLPAAHSKHKEVLALGSSGTTTHQVAAASSSDNDDNKLSELLSRAAMEDKTVIMAITNEAWTASGSLMDLFLESFRTDVKTESLLKHLVIVTMDTKSWERCASAHPLCYALDVGGANFTSEQRFMAEDYLDMMWRRIRLQGRVLELGYSFLLTDVDIVYLPFRNLLLRVPVAADMAMACDRFRGHNPYDLDKGANAGLVYARASARTAEFYRVWYESRNLFPGKKTQDVFEKIKHQLTARLGVTLQLVDTAYFGTFCDRQRKERDFNKLCTFHANCILGLENKVHKLRAVLNEWKQFKAASNNGTALN